MLYLASSLRKKGFSVSIFDPTTEKPIKLQNKHYYYGITDERFKSYIEKVNPDVVGISIPNRFSLEGAFKVAKIAKSISNKIITIAGGVYPSVYKEKIFSQYESNSIDFAFQGEAENSFSDFISSYPTVGLNSVDGLIYRSENNIICNKKVHFINNLDELPFPARDLVDIKSYTNSGPMLYGLGSQPALSLLTSRSCPYQCTFCNMKLIHGPDFVPALQKIF